MITSVGHCIILRSERIVLLRSFKECNVLFRSFFEFLAPYETQKNDAFFCVLFLRTLKNIKNAMFFCKERKRMQRTQRSYAKERRMLRSFEKSPCPTLILFFNIYIDTVYIDKYIYSRYTDI